MIGDATPQQLAVIVGLPRPANEAAKIALEDAFPRWRVISESFPDEYERIYVGDDHILATLGKVCAFAAEQPELPVPRPGRIVLLYVSAPGHRRLFDAFGYAALPIRLDEEDWHWPKGKHWRVDSNVTHRLLVAAIAETETGTLHELRLRLERAETSDALLLPPRNFHVADEGSLTPRFDRLLEDGGIEDEVFNDLAVQHFAFHELKAFFKRVPANKGLFRLDQRGLIFATAPRGQHGPLRAEDLEDINELSHYRLLLEGLYRFGTPLRGAFQHDVQWQNASLRNEEFYCARTGGVVSISGSHANVFANDVVR